MTNWSVPGDAAASVREIFRSHIGEIQAGEKKLASEVKFNPEQVFFMTGRPSPVSNFCKFCSGVWRCVAIRTIKIAPLTEHKSTFNEQSVVDYSYLLTLGNSRV